MKLKPQNKEFTLKNDNKIEKPLKTDKEKREHTIYQY